MGRLSALILAASLGWSVVSATSSVGSTTTTTSSTTSPTTTSTPSQNQIYTPHITALIAHTESTQAGLETNPSPTPSPSPTPTPTTTTSEESPTGAPAQGHQVSTDTDNNTPNVATPNNATPTPTPTTTVHHPEPLSAHTESTQPSLDSPTTGYAVPSAHTESSQPSLESAHTESGQSNLQKPTKTPNKNSAKTTTTYPYQGQRTNIAHLQSTQASLDAPDGYSTTRIYASAVLQSTAPTLAKPSPVTGHQGSTLDVPSEHETGSPDGGQRGDTGHSNVNSPGTGSSPTPSLHGLGGLIASAVDQHGSPAGSIPNVTPAPHSGTWMIHGTPVVAGGPGKTIDGTTYFVPKSGGAIWVNGTPTKLPKATPTATGKGGAASDSKHTQGAQNRMQTTKKPAAHHTSPTSSSTSSTSPSSTSTHHSPSPQSASANGAGRWLPSLGLSSLGLLMALV